jgi:hypothetical protein
MPTQPNWSNWFTNHPSNDAGNKNMQAISDILSSGDPTDSKIQSSVEDIDTVILAADANKKVMNFHSPKNFGGTRIQPKNKVMAMLGLGTQATWVQIVLNTALADFNIIVPTVDKLAACKTADKVAANPIPEASGIVGFEGSANFIPAPLFRNAILKANTCNPFELIPLMTQSTRAFDAENENDKSVLSKAINHADDLNGWLYGVKQGLIGETQYSVDPDDKEAQVFFANRHFQYIKNLSWKCRRHVGDVSATCQFVADLDPACVSGHHLPKT